MKPSIFASARRAALALGLSVATAVPALVTPAAAAPIAPIAQPSVPAASESIVNIDYKGWKHRGNYYGRHNYGRHYRRHHYRDRAGAALGLGVGIGVLGALAARPYYEPDYRYARPRPVYRDYGLSRGHVEWCYNRYRSYRAYDNSFQPYGGPRQQCYSPYS